MRVSLFGLLDLYEFDALAHVWFAGGVELLLPPARVKLPRKGERETAEKSGKRNGISENEGNVYTNGGPVL
jgi:hypothetical protein